MGGKKFFGFFSRLANDGLLATQFSREQKRATLPLAARNGGPKGNGPQFASGRALLAFG